jgi:hypothetical protein
MKISQLSAKPQLIEVVIDDEAIVKEYGEAITMYTWDRQPIEVFLKLAALKNADTAMILEVARDLILDEKGEVVLKEGVTLPTNVLIAAMSKVTELLGK